MYCSLIITIITMMLCINILQETPVDFPVEKPAHHQIKWIRNVATRIVYFCWQGPLSTDMHATSQGHAHPTCQAQDEDIYAYCVCRRRKYYHLICFTSHKVTMVIAVLVFAHVNHVNIHCILGKALITISHFWCYWDCKPYGALKFFKWPQLYSVHMGPHTGH